MHSRSNMYELAPRRSAQALIEFALILPVMLIIVLGSIDIGRALVFGVAVQDGARAAARLGGTAASDGAMANPDRVVRQRLIDASTPALDACDATIGWGLQPQPCGWTFTIEIVNGAFNASSIAGAQAADTAANCKPAGVGSPVCQFPGSELKVTARGEVSMWKGFTAWNWSLFPIWAQGQAAGVVLW